MSDENQAKCRSCGLKLIGKRYYVGCIALHPVTREPCEVSSWGGFVCSDNCEKVVNDNESKWQDERIKYLHEKLGYDGESKTGELMSIEERTEYLTKKLSLDNFSREKQSKFDIFLILAGPTVTVVAVIMIVLLVFGIYEGVN